VAEAALAGRRVRLPTRPLLVGAAALALALLAVPRLLALRGVERTDDAFVDGHVVFLSPRVAGHVLAALVEENQHVRAGQPLVRLDPADFEARVDRARADLDAARNRMAQSQAAADAAAARSLAAGVRLRHAERELERAQGLLAQGAGSRTALDAALATRDAAAADLHAAREGERAERAALGNEAPARQAEAALHEAELALAYAVVTAPFDGVVGRKSVEPGANVSPGQPLLALTAESGSWVSANFKETQIREMRAGDPAEVRLDAFPDALLRGHVESLSPATGATYALLPPDNASGNFTKVVQRVPVRIALDAVVGGSAGVAAGPDGRPWLPVGLSADVRVRVR
jgi:membrane fusion protein (multidrug efflux system)